MRGCRCAVVAVFFCLSLLPFSPSAGEEKKEGKGGESPMFQMDPFVLNIAGSGGPKFLKVTMCFELSSPALAERAKARNAAIRDAVIMLVTSKSSEAVSSPEDKLQLKDELIMRCNQVLGEDFVKNVYFTDFVMQ